MTQLQCHSFPLLWKNLRTYMHIRYSKVLVGLPHSFLTPTTHVFFLSSFSGQFLYTFRAFFRNLLRGTRRKKIFSYFFKLKMLGLRFWHRSYVFVSQHTHGHFQHFWKKNTEVPILHRKWRKFLILS